MCGIHHLEKFAGPFSRRDLLRLSLAGAVGVSTSGWFETLARAAIDDKNRRRSCILLWMNGGPSQMDTFDLKPGTRNGGLFKDAGTDVTGMNISEHLPQLGKWSNVMAIVRSDDRQRRRSWPAPRIRPHRLRSRWTDSLSHARFARRQRTRPTRCGTAQLCQHRPRIARSVPPPTPPVFSGRLRPANRRRTVRRPRLPEPTIRTSSSKISSPRPKSRRQSSVRDSSCSIPLTPISSKLRPGSPANSYKAAYQRAVELMQSKLAAAFKLDEEPAAIRDAYGRTRFGQGCLLARRLVERGVPFVEVTLGAFADAAAGWDTHTDNFDQVRKLSGVLDPAWATLMRELDQRGLLDSTLIIWMGEFGRTPQINANGGRDHFPQAFSSVLAGGGIRGGQVIGKTSDDGMSVQDRPVTVPDFLATVCRALGIDPTIQNNSDIGRPIRIVDPAAKPIAEVLS